MTPQQFMENFGVIADSPEGIVKLRALVLSLATSGALSVRLKADGVAADLLVESKAMLEARKVGRRRRGRAQASDAQRCHDVPSTWCWGKLGDLGLTQTGATPKKDLLQADGPRIPFIRPGDIAGGRVDISREPIPMVAAETTGRIVEPGAVLMVCIGSVGKVGLCLGRATFNQQINAIQPVVASSAYIALALRTPSFQKRCKALASATTISILNKGKWESLSLPVPPLAEQKRIVAKVDELMAMLDDLEQRQEKKRTVAIHVSKASLDTLVNAEDPDQLARAWERVSKNFGVVAAANGGIKRLHHAILELAVRGRLEESSPCSGVVDAILDSITCERRELKALGKFRGKVEFVPLEGTPPFSIPDSWRWVPLEALCTQIVDCLHRTPRYTSEGFPAIRTNDIRPGKILVQQARRVPEIEYIEQTRRLTPRGGDVFYSREGNFGVAAVVPSDLKLCLSQRMMQFRVGAGVVPEYFSWALNSPPLFAQAEKDALGATVPHVNIRSLRRFWFPLPPTVDQNKIVERIGRLRALVSELESLNALKCRCATSLSKLNSDPRV